MGQPRFGLRLKFVLIVISALSVTLGWATAKLFAQQEVLIERQLLQKGQALGRFASLIAPQPILAYDFIALDRMVEEIDTEEDIVMAVFLAPNGRPMTGRFEPPLGFKHLPVGETRSEALLNALEHISSLPHVVDLHFPITHDGKTLGSLTILLDRSHLLAEQSTLAWGHMALYGAIFLLLSAIIILAFQFQVISPIRALQAVTIRVARHQLDQPVELVGNDEFSLLGQSFNHMMGELKHAREDLEESEGRFRDFAENGADWFWELGTDLRFTYIAGKAEKVMGLKPAEIIGKSEQEIYQEISDLDSPEWQQHLQRIGDHQPFSQIDIPWHRSGGKNRYVSLSGKPRFDEDGNFLGYRGVGRDITESKRAEEALRESEQRQRDMLDNTSSVIYMKDLEGRYLFVNRKYKTLFQVSDDEIKGKTAHEVFPPDVADAIHANDLKAVSTTTPLEFEETIPLDDGDHTYISVRFPLRHVSGEIYAVCGISTDITERRQAEKALQAAVKAVVEVTGQQHFDKTVDLLCQWFNADAAAICELVGQDRVRVIAMVHDGEPVADYEYDLKGTPCSEVVTKGPCIYPQNVCEHFPVDKVLMQMEACSYAGVPLRSPAGAVVGVLWVISRRPFNVTEHWSSLLEIIASKSAAEIERKKVGDALRESEERYRSIFESVAASIILVDKGGHVVDINPYHVTTIAKGRATKEDFLGQDILAHPSIVEAGLSKTYKQVLEGKAVDKKGIHFPLEAGDMCGYFNVRGVPLLIRGSMSGAVFVHEDITERKEVEETLRQKNEELRRSNDELESFAYVASHDLREPLRNVTNFSTLLDRRLAGRLAADEQDYLEYIHNGALRMDHLVRDLLNFSRVGRLCEPKSRVAMRAVLDRVLGDMRSQLEESGAEVEIASDLPVVTANRDELERVVMNLLGNALKYRSPECTPHISIGCVEEGGMWRFHVQDNGIGIQQGKGYEERIFRLFQRLHQRHEYDGGTGVGLAVCRKIIEQHGGRIWVESEPDKGSTFFFTLPSEE